jgi:integrase
MAVMSGKMPTGIDLLPSGKYRARVKGYGGGTFTRLRDAEKWLNETRILKETGQPPAPKAVTLADLALDYLTSERPRLSDKFYESRRNLWAAHLDQRVRPAPPPNRQRGREPDRQWRHPLVETRLPAITPRMIELWRDERLQATTDERGKPSVDAVATLMSFMTTVFDRGVRDQYIDRNPMKAVRKPKPPSKPYEGKGIMPLAVEKIRAQLDGQDALMVAVLGYAGLRPGEARGLKFGDLGHTIWIERAIGKNDPKGTKTEHPRSVRLVKPLADDLAAWKTKLGASDDDWVFPRPDGDPWRETDWRNWQKRVFKPAARRAGVKIDRPYDLRGSAASLWLHEGKDSLQVAEWLGDNIATIHKHYLRAIREFRDSDRHKDAETIIREARRDALMTPQGVQRGPTESKGSPRKASKQAV